MPCNGNSGPSTGPVPANPILSGVQSVTLIVVVPPLVTVPLFAEQASDVCCALAGCDNKPPNATIVAIAIQRINALFKAINVIVRPVDSALHLFGGHNSTGPVTLACSGQRVLRCTGAQLQR